LTPSLALSFLLPHTLPFSTQENNNDIITSTIYNTSKQSVWCKPFSLMDYVLQQSIGSQLVERGEHIGNIYIPELINRDCLDTYM